MSTLPPPSLPASNRIVLVAVPPLTQQHALDLIHEIRCTSPDRDDAFPNSRPPPPPPSGPPREDTLRWTIRNRYYTADVEFVICDNLEELRAPNGNYQPEDDDDVPPAVVVLASNPSAGTSSTLSRLSSRSPEWDVALLLSLPHAVPPANSSSPSLSSSTSPPDEGAWDDLALSHGFEWVDFASSPASASAPSLSAQDEKDSSTQSPLFRVIEALSAHMWEGMDRLPPAPPAGLFTRPSQPRSDQNEEGEEDEEEDEEGEADTAGLGAPPLPHPRPYVPPVVEFPSTFLPSIRRNRNGAPPSATSVSTSATIPTDSPREGHPAFEDDFSPFVSGPSPTLAPPIPPAGQGQGLGDLLAAFDDEEGQDEHDELDLPAPRRRTGGAEGDEGEGDLPEIESFEALFARLSTMQSSIPPPPPAALSSGGVAAGGEEEETEEARDARRAAAERLVKEVFGAHGVGWEDSDEEEY
ncbi:hypothetical protein JCM11251_005564 [Rhodosporidiobolus azoricus]